MICHALIYEIHTYYYIHTAIRTFRKVHNANWSHNYTTVPI